MAGVGRRIVLAIALAGIMGGAGCLGAWAQLPMPNSQPQAPNPLTNPTATPGEMLLYNLEAKFAKDVAANGGAGFASWFASNGVVLGNGVAPVVGQAAIAKSATWSPKNYQLTWTPNGAWMSPTGDTGYTWGKYETHTVDGNGSPLNTSGRYITVWGKQANGSWKVELEASANAPTETDNCCKLPATSQ